MGEAKRRRQMGAAFGVKTPFENYLDTKTHRVFDPKKMESAEPKDIITIGLAHASALAMFNVRHVYEFGHLLSDYLDEELDTMNALHDEAWRMQRAGTFHLPFPEVCYSWTQRGGGDTYIVYLTSDQTKPEGSLNIAPHRPPGIFAGFVTGDADGWFEHPTVFFADPTLDAVLRIDSLLLENGEDRDEEKGGPETIFMRAMLATMLILRNAPIYEEVDGVERKARDLRRRQRNARPLPETIHRVKHINYVSVLPRPTGGVGSPKSPHDRSGHWRRVPGKEPQWIKPMKVKGGSQGAVRVIHNVKD